jgi:hypothetical protein
VIVAILVHPTTYVVLTGAAMYVGKIVAAQIDRTLGDAVARLFDGLVERFKKPWKKLSTFWNVMTKWAPL